MDENASKADLGLLDLPWEDVLVPHVLSHVPLQTLVQLQRVSKQFLSLIQLYLANCRHFHLAPLGPTLPREAFCSLLRDSRSLQSLSLHCCSDWLSDSDLLPVIGQNLQLHRVELRGCSGLTRRSLVAVSLTCAQLSHLGLAHCEWVDALSLRSLADHCLHLQSIDLTACRRLKDESVCYLARKCVKLRSVSLAVNANVTDEAVEALAKSCRGLESLDLTGCLRVHDHSIRTLAEYCPGLLSLRVNHCHNVSEQSLEPLRRRGVEMDVEPPHQRALVLLQDVLGFAPFINLQI
ncbi:unnamed protein product [Knipowitschia caucasica]|uniref:F-box/LRR-repeat protein 15 n=1 Tax=Knipowitschia caucasica TaxID=637954 RepID=A0AAV2LGG3_KNICA